MQIDPAFARFIETLHGDAGAAWLARLPDILRASAERWGLTLGEPFPNLTYHFVMRATRADGQPVVVKACAPTGEYAEEAAALRHFAGRGMARLLAAHDADQMLLLERLVPGTTLVGMADDAEATRIATGVMRQIWRPVTTDFPFPTIQKWGRGLARLRAHYDGGTGPFPAALVTQAERIHDEFMATLDPPVLLHGDLHHDNILAAERAPWLAIDPKGVLGEPAYEVGAWLHNPLTRILHEPDLPRLLAQRVDILAGKLGFARRRVWGWGLYAAVLSAWWSVEDEGQPGADALLCAQALADHPPA